jgi:hypothetical protein
MRREIAPTMHHLPDAIFPLVYGLVRLVPTSTMTAWMLWTKHILFGNRELKATATPNTPDISIDAFRLTYSPEQSKEANDIAYMSAIQLVLVWDLFLGHGSSPILKVRWPSNDLTLPGVDHYLAVHTVS